MAIPPQSHSLSSEKSMIFMLLTSELQQAQMVTESPEPKAQPSLSEPMIVLKPIHESKPDSVSKPTIPMLQSKALKLKPKPTPNRKFKTKLQKVDPPSLGPAPRPSLKDTLVDSNGPRVMKRVNPIYPERAKLLGIEGLLSVMYDVNRDGQVENVRILSAQPRNIFEHAVRLAMRRWAYETGKPTINLMLTFKFNLRSVNN